MPHTMNPPRLNPHARHHAWTVDHGDDGYSWHRRLTLGRTQLGYHLYWHTNPARTTDRWVFQPWITIDRKGS